MLKNKENMEQFNLIENIERRENENSNASAVNYESSRPKKKKYLQKYKTTWEVGRLWLKREGDMAFCKICQKSMVPEIFNIERHETSTKHAKLINEDNHLNQITIGERIGQENIYKWLPGDIQCLIDLIEKHKTKFDSIQKNKVWELIATEISSIQNKNISGEQCNGKWKGLKAMYRKINDHNHTSSNSRNWEFYEQMASILSKNQEFTPPATCSSDDVPNDPLAADSLEPDYGFSVINVIESDTSKQSTLSQSKERKIKDSSIDIEAARERRHAERMELQREFLELFRTLVNSLQPAHDKKS